MGGIINNYALNRSALPSLWHVQEGINLIKIEVVTLEDAGFLFSKKPRCPFINPVGDNIFAPIN